MRKFNVTVNGQTYQVEVEETGATQNLQAQPIVQQPKVEAVQPVQQPKASVVVDGAKVTAPMPGNIIKISAKDGATVKKGEVIFVLEAMKMENDIVSPADGKISVNISEGAAVSTGDTLAVIA